MAARAGTAWRLRRRSMLSTRWPRSTAARTTAAPMNPQPPVTRTRMAPASQALTVMGGRVRKALTWFSGLDRALRPWVWRRVFEDELPDLGVGVGDDLRLVREEHRRPIIRVELRPLRQAGCAIGIAGL